MSEWQPIETAPKDADIILYWPRYTYDGTDTYELIAIGRWKTNSRLETHYADGSSKYSPAEEANVRAKYAAAYFSDNDELDDYGLAEPEHAPTHWMPLPEPPHPIEGAQ